MATRRRHTPEQIIRKLREALEAPCRGPTGPRGRQGPGGLRADLPPLEGPVRRHEADDAKRLKEPERENTRLKRIVADQLLENEALREIALGSW
jgi:hypothetical protein